MNPYFALIQSISAIFVLIDSKVFPMQKPSTNLLAQTISYYFALAIARILVKCRVQSPFIHVIRYIAHEQSEPFYRPISQYNPVLEGGVHSLGSQSSRVGSSQVFPFPFLTTVSLFPGRRCFPVLASSCAAPGRYAEDCWMRSVSNICRVTLGGRGLLDPLGIGAGVVYGAALGS